MIQDVFMKFHEGGILLMAWQKKQACYFFHVYDVDMKEGWRFPLFIHFLFHVTGARMKLE